MKKNNPGKDRISRREFLREVPAVAGLAVAALALPNPLLAADFNATGSAADQQTANLSLNQQSNCEYLENPIGVDVSRPRLSWKLESNIQGQKQTAYQTRKLSLLCLIITQKQPKIYFI